MLHYHTFRCPLANLHIIVLCSSAPPSEHPAHKPKDVYAPRYLTLEHCRAHSCQWTLLSGEAWLVSLPLHLHVPFYRFEAPPSSSAGRPRSLLPIHDVFVSVRSAVTTTRGRSSMVELRRQEYATCLLLLAYFLLDRVHLRTDLCSCILGYSFTRSAKRPQCLWKGGTRTLPMVHKIRNYLVLNIY